MLSALTLKVRIPFCFIYIYHPIIFKQDFREKFSVTHKSVLFWVKFVFSRQIFEILTIYNS